MPLQQECSSSTKHTLGINTQPRSHTWSSSPTAAHLLAAALVPLAALLHATGQRARAAHHLQAGRKQTALAAGGVSRAMSNLGTGRLRQPTCHLPPHPSSPGPRPCPPGRPRARARP